MSCLDGQMERLALFIRKPCRSACLLLLSLNAASCAAPIITVDDVVCAPGEKAAFVAYVEYEVGPILRKDLEKVKVRFLIDGREVGRDATDDEGRASAEARIPADGPSQFEAVATWHNRELRAQGRIFAWDKDSILIAVDVDGTISHTDYDELVFKDENEESDPFKTSRQTLEELSEDFRIVYFTARPRFLLDKTRQWLAEEKFPPGPVITAPSVRQAIRPGEYKRKRLAEIRDDWPGLLIGIGNTKADAHAYGASKMLTLLVAKSREAKFGRHVLCFENWKALAAFFEANRDILTDAKSLKQAIDGKLMLRLAVPKYRED